MYRPGASAQPFTSFTADSWGGTAAMVLFFVQCGKVLQAGLHAFQ
jgi:hypothetical protein